MNYLHLPDGQRCTHCQQRRHTAARGQPMCHDSSWCTSSAHHLPSITTPPSPGPVRITTRCQHLSGCCSRDEPALAWLYQCTCRAHSASQSCAHSIQWYSHARTSHQHKPRHQPCQAASGCMSLRADVQHAHSASTAEFPAVCLQTGVAPGARQPAPQHAIHATRLVWPSLPLAALAGLRGATPVIWPCQHAGTPSSGQHQANIRPTSHGIIIRASREHLAQWLGLRCPTTPCARRSAAHLPIQSLVKNGLTNV